MVLKGVAGDNVIDIKMAVFEGKLASGSIGLVFSFLGSLLLATCFMARYTSRIEIDKSADGTLKLSHKGGFTTSKATAIKSILYPELPASDVNKTIDSDEE